MIHLTFQNKITMFLHAVLNPAGLITLVLFGASLVGTIMNFNGILLILTVFLLIVFDIAACDLPRTLLTTHEAIPLKVSGISKAMPKDVGYYRDSSHDIPNWDAKGPKNEKIRMVYHTKTPPVVSGETILVLKGFRGKYYGFKDIR